MSDVGEELQAVLNEQEDHAQDLYQIQSLHVDCDNLTVWFSDEIEREKATDLMRALLFLDSIAEDGEVITLMLTSPGGSVASTLALVDLFELLAHPVRAIGFGSVCSGAALLLIAAKERYVFPTCQVMLHASYDTVGTDGPEVLGRREHNEYLQDMDFAHSVFAHLLRTRTRLAPDTILDGHDHWFRGAVEIAAVGIADPLKQGTL